MTSTYKNIGDNNKTFMLNISYQKKCIKNAKPSKNNLKQNKKKTLESSTSQSIKEFPSFPRFFLVPLEISYSKNECKSKTVTIGNLSNAKYVKK